MKIMTLTNEIQLHNDFDEKVHQTEGRPLHAHSIETLQVNIGLTCNLQCVHCHVASSPKRKEQMSWETMEHVISAAKRIQCRKIDITGGAPEMNPHFMQFIRKLKKNNFHVQVRTNLTVLLLRDYVEVVPFYAEHKIALVASLPCYLDENVDSQRGKGTYSDSIKVLRRLNQVGYGIDKDLQLHLIYNPIGSGLPSNQKELEEDYRRELNRRFNIHFNQLFTLTNMPIGRFLSDLKKRKKDQEYHKLLAENFNPQTLPELMCRRQISVDWNGVIYDCDFNLATRMPVNHGILNQIKDVDVELLKERQIVTGRHCFGCTAGSGSSCGGALIKK